MSEEKTQIPLSEQQKRLYVEMLDGMVEKTPEFVDDLTKQERKDLARVVKKDNESKAKEKEDLEKLQREENTIWDQVSKDSNGKIRPMATIENLEILVNKIGYELKYNSMTNKLEFMFKGEKVADEFDDIYPAIMSHAVENELPREGLQSYIPSVAKKQEYHPVKYIIENATWDRHSRMQEVINCFNFSEISHANIVMRKFFIGAVGSLFQKSFFTKLVPVLHGEQSFKKTAALGRIFNISDGSWLEGHALKESSKDSVMEAVSCWCCELGEMETTTSGEQGWLKAFLPKAFDTYRPPYGRGAVTRRRQSVFVGTVNKSDFLKDETGSTRFAVLSLSKAVNIDKLNKILGWTYDNDRVLRVNNDNLVQFWAEVKYYFDQGEGWMLSDIEMINSLNVNDAYQDKGAYYSVVKDYIEELHTAKGTTIEWMTAKQVCDHLRINPKLSRNVARIFKELFESEERRSRVRFYKIPIYARYVMNN